MLLAQISLAALFVSLLLGRAGWAADETAALAFALAPVVVGLALVIITCVPLGAYVLAPVVLGVTIGLRAQLPRIPELLHQPVTALLALTIVFWVAQEALIVCHGRAFYAQDWHAHYNQSGVITARMLDGLFPVIPHRTAWLGVWSAPALWSVQSYATFQLATAFAHALAFPVVYLWARRMGDSKDGQRAWLVTLTSAGLTFGALYTWPKVLAAQLMLLALYFYTYSAEAPGRGRRLVYDAAAGLVLAIAFQAHQYTIAYAVAFFAAAWALPRRYPWAAACIFASMTAAWMWILVNRYPGEWWSTPYFDPEQVTFSRQWEYFTTHLRCTFIPAWSNMGEVLVAPDRFLRDTTDVMLMNLPILVTVALLLVGWRLGWRRADAIVGLTLAAGGLGTLWLLEGAGIGVVQASLVPILLWLCALGGTASRHLWPPLARALCTLSVVQYVVFRGFALVMNVAAPDEGNLSIKAVAGVIYLGDVWPFSATLSVMLLAGLALLVWGQAVGWRQNSA